MTIAKQINKIYIQKQSQFLLSQLGYFYVPCKSNQKKVKDFLLSLPYFWFDHNTQSTVYDIIKNNNVKCFIDTKSSFQRLCYKIYHDISIKLEMIPIEYNEFYQNIRNDCYSEERYLKHLKYQNIHSYIFFLFIMGFIGLWFKLKDV